MLWNTDKVTNDKNRFSAPVDPEKLGLADYHEVILEYEHTLMHSSSVRSSCG